MPGELERRLMKHGTSRVVALPKSYLRFYGLENGGKVKVLYNDFIIIFPKKLENIINKNRELIDKIFNIDKLGGKDI
jgi:antitoxin component of MazEF toxin-antitoxin module